MPKPNINKIALELEDAVNDYTKGLKAIEKDMYNAVLNKLKDLTTDTQGNIKATVNNYKIISQAKGEMNKVLNSDKYLEHVSKVNKYYSDMTSIQQSYFTAMFKDFSAPAVIKELKDLALNTTVETLTEAGINDMVVNKATNIISDNIRSGRTFAEMTDELEEFIKGSDPDKVPGKLTSYSKQIVNDALRQYVGNYTKVVSDDLGLEWYEYIGGIMEDVTRPMCIHLVNKRFIHKSEFKGITEGRVDGKEVSKQGMMPNTDENNFEINVGGYNCQHLVQPIPPEEVPEEVREKFEKPIEPNP